MGINNQFGISNPGMLSMSGLMNVLSRTLLVLLVSLASAVPPSVDNLEGPVKNCDRSVNKYAVNYEGPGSKKHPVPDNKGHKPYQVLTGDSFPVKRCCNACAKDPKCKAWVLRRTETPAVPCQWSAEHPNTYLAGCLVPGQPCPTFPTLLQAKAACATTPTCAGITSRRNGASFELRAGSKPIPVPASDQEASYVLQNAFDCRTGLKPSCGFFSIVPELTKNTSGSVIVGTMKPSPSPPKPSPTPPKPSPSPPSPSSFPSGGVCGSTCNGTFPVCSCPTAPEKAEFPGARVSRSFPLAPPPLLTSPPVDPCLYMCSLGERKNGVVYHVAFFKNSIKSAADSEAAIPDCSNVVGCNKADCNE